MSPDARSWWELESPGFASDDLPRYDSTLNILTPSPTTLRFVNAVKESLLMKAGVVPRPDGISLENHLAFPMYEGDCPLAAFARGGAGGDRREGTMTRATRASSVPNM